MYSNAAISRTEVCLNLERRCLELRAHDCTQRVLIMKHLSGSFETFNYPTLVRCDRHYLFQTVWNCRSPPLCHFLKAPEAQSGQKKESAEMRRCFMSSFSRRNAAFRLNAAAFTAWDITSFQPPNFHISFSLTICIRCHDPSPERTHIRSKDSPVVMASTWSRALWKRR